MPFERCSRFIQILALAAALAGAPACLSTQVGQVTAGGGSIGGSSGGKGSSGSSGSGGGTSNDSASGGGSTGAVGRGSPTISLSTQTGPTTASATYPNPCEIDLNFGNVPIGYEDNATIQVQNHGTGALDLSQANPVLDPEFGLLYGSQPPIQPGEFGEFAVTFQPYEVGEVTSTFTIQTNGLNPACPGPPGGTSGDILTIELTGNGIELSLVATPNPLDFGNTKINSTSEKNLTLQNTGTAPVTGITCTLGGSDATLFQVVDCPSMVAAGAGTTVQMDYSPIALETRSLATIMFTGSGGQTLTLPLFGEPTQ